MPSFLTGKSTLSKISLSNIFFYMYINTGNHNTAQLERCRLQPAKRPEMLKSSKYFLENAEVGIVNMCTTYDNHELQAWEFQGIFIETISLKVCCALEGGGESQWLMHSCR